MDYEGETGTNMLQRILALLLSLALTAERAAGCSYPVRCYLLWLLRRAEPYAWRCVMRECNIAADDKCLQRIPLRMIVCNSPADALRIAETYRTLARALQRRVRDDQRLAHLWSCHDQDWIDLDWGKRDWLAPFAGFAPTVTPSLPALCPDIALAPDTS